MDRVLLVDDDPKILQALERVLRNEGYEVRTFQDPREAATQADFAVVITDFMMPHLTGIELLSRLRETNPHAIRILLTAAADFRVATEAVNRGEIFRLLSKPWTLPDLCSCVRQAVTHFHLLERNRRLEQEVRAKNDELREMNTHLSQLVNERTRGLLEGMISALDYRDTETQWHSRRVAYFSRRIGEAAGATPLELDIIEQGALLHDIGKIGVRDSILLKPSKLTPEEWEEMRMHPEMGYRMLARVPYLHDASLIVLQHQERWDGSGYPAGLKGEQIVLGARVFTLADTLDAITSDRPYRQGRPFEVARQEIKRCAGTQFDPRLVEAFLSIPDTEWVRIRREVEQMEQAESLRFGPNAVMRPEGDSVR